VATALLRAGSRLDDEVDRRVAGLRARAVENGYDDDILKALLDIDEDVSVIAGRIATWYGKQQGGLPSAFGCRRDPVQQRAVGNVAATTDEVAGYLTALHAELRLADVPAFAATRLFFMAGEGNRHPKHIAYFLPDDEGVKGSPYKKTYYFTNTHRALLAHESAPLAARFLDVGVPFEPADPRFATVPTVGVLGHEYGHCVHRSGASYAALNAADRWASVVLQEVAADVFGILVASQVWAGRLGIPPSDLVPYDLAECLRYVNRGLGRFPDSDGMFLQLNYFLQVGALEVTQRADGPRLTGDPETVVAGLRSLARILADALLAGQAPAAIAVHERFGPASPDRLGPFVDSMREFPPQSIEYLQEHVRTVGLHTTS
jgi:hypothetical protein